MKQLLKTAVQFIKCKVLLLMLFAFYTTVSIAQTTQELPAMIESNMKLEAGNYLIKKNIYIKKGVVLTLKSGTNLLLGPDVNIIIGGNIQIEGNPKEFVNITSLDDENPGGGLVFREFGTGYSALSYVKFKHLKKPLFFQKNWFRDSVNIVSCQFKDLKKNEISIEFQDIDQIQAEKSTHVRLESNTFSNNSGGILIANIANDYIKYYIQNNVITRNEYTGRESNGIFSSPLFINYHTSPAANIPVIKGNSISYNYSSMIFRDTVEFFPVNITTIGSAESLELSGNYFGDKSSEELAKSFDQVTANQRAPFVYFNNLISTPPEELNGHIYKIMVNNLPIGEDEPYKQWKEGIKEISLIGNRPLYPGKTFSVAYHFMENDTLFVKYLEHSFSLKDGGKLAKIELLDNMQKKVPNGYFEIDGLYDEQLFEVPAVTIGKKIFLNNNRDIFFKFKDLDEIPKKISTKKYIESDTNILDKIQNELAPIDTNYFKFKPYYEFEIFSGSSIYFGDLAVNGVRFYPANARPAIGVRGGWHFKKRYKLELRSDYLVLVGDDNINSTVGKSRGTGFTRNLNTRTNVAELGLLLEFDLFRIAGPKYWIPSGFIGTNVFYFKPMGKYEGNYYDLRKIGTEGQTLNGAKNAYPLFSYGIPMGLKIRKELNKTTSVAFSYTYTKVFTDYLDDLSVGYYPDPAALKAANPDLGDVAVKLSNPGNISGKRSSSANKDGYAYYGFSVIFHFR